MTVYTGWIGYSKTNGPIIVSQPKVGDKFMKVKLFEPFRAKWTTNKTHGTVCIQRKSKLNQRSKYSYRLAEQSHRYCINCSHERREGSRNDNKINFILCIFFITGGKGGEREGHKYGSLTDNLLMVITWRLSLRNISTDNDCKETFRMHMDIG